MKKLKVIGLILGVVVSLNLYITSCKTPAIIQAKTSAQLWGENCSRCHNVPSPADFSDSEWELIGTHMRVRANLTAEETNKIIEFMQSAN